MDRSVTTGAKSPSASWWTAGLPTRCSLSGVWKSLELEPTREMEFILADGTRVSRGISECWIELPQGRGHTPVILGEPRDDALLGVVTLEEMGLVLNPFERSLQPMRARLT